MKYRFFPLIELLPGFLMSSLMKAQEPTKLPTSPTGTGKQGEANMKSDQKKEKAREKEAEVGKEGESKGSDKPKYKSLLKTPTGPIKKSSRKEKLSSKTVKNPG